MKRQRFCLRLLLAVAVVAISLASPLYAEDRLISGAISGTQIFDSPEGIIFDDAVIAAGANVTAFSNFEVRLRPGTRIADNTRFSVQMRDNDGLSNRCEIASFGDLSHSPNADDDGDGRTNIQECELGSNPNQYNNPDSDEDGLPDEWELQQFGNLANGSADDTDGDGLSNLVEFEAGLNAATPTDYVAFGESLQAAIDGTADGATILVGPGTFDITNLTIAGKAITLRSIQGPDKTILRNAIGSYSILLFSPRAGAQSTVEGFTLTKAARGAVVIDSASPIFKRCVFRDNMNNVYQGGACRINSGAPRFENCAFVANWTDVSVGAVFSAQSTPSFVNCTFRGNQIPTLRNSSGTNASIVNCTFVGSTGANPAKRNNSVIHNENSSATIVNTIIRLDRSTNASNEQPAVGNSGSGSATISNSDIEGSGGSGNWNTIFGSDGGNNLDIDPLFVSATDFHLVATSPCINKGTTSGAPGFDMDGDPRPVQGQVDIGADEFNVLPVVNYFTRSPDQIFADQSTTLGWAVSHAQSIHIDPDVGDVAASGTRSVSPDVTTTYTLSATNVVGTATRQVTVNVLTDPQITSFSASSQNIYGCNGTNLSWQTHNAPTVSMLPDVIGPSLPPEGSVRVFPMATTTYRLAATNGDRTAQATVTITVNRLDDSDNDGLMDNAEDANHNGHLDAGETHPCNADSDNDGMSDGWEIQYSLNPLVDDSQADRDGDGFENEIEFFGHSNPNDVASVPHTLEYEFDGSGNLTRTEKVNHP